MSEAQAINDVSKPLGKRDSNKLAKEKAIHAAAERLFLEKGYDATTLREIAKTAGVGFGTLFAYSQDKAGLLAMIFVDRLETLPPLFHDMRSEETLEEMLIRAFGHLYSFWASVPSLSYHVLEQMEFFQANPYVDRIVERRASAQAELRDWVIAMQGRGSISNKLDAADVSATLFAIYTSAVRKWSATTPEDVVGGLSSLHRLLKIAVRGLRC